MDTKFSNKLLKNISLNFILKNGKQIWHTSTFFLKTKVCKINNGYITQKIAQNKQKQRKQSNNKKI